MGAVWVRSELDERGWAIDWTDESVEQWKAHPHYPLWQPETDEAEETAEAEETDEDEETESAPWNGSHQLGQGVHHVFAPCQEPAPTPRVSPVTVDLRWEFPFHDDMEGALAYEPEESRGDLRQWSAACRAPFVAILDALFDGHWPPRHGPLATEPPVLDTATLPEAGSEILSDKVDRWVGDLPRIDLVRALASVDAGRSPFGDVRVRWIHARRGALVRFRVPLLNVAWELDITHLDHFAWVSALRTWLRIDVDSKGDVRSVAILAAGTDPDDGTYAMQDDPHHLENAPLADMISEHAYKAYMDLVEEFHQDFMFGDDEDEDDDPPG